MRKIFVIVVALCLVFSSCSVERGATPTDLASAALEASGGIGESELLYSEAEELSRGYMSENMRELIYDGGDISGAAAYAVALSKTISGGELHIFRARHLSDRGRLERICRSRAATLHDRDVYIFSPEAYERVFSSAQVYVRGLYVCMLATPDNAAAIRAIDRLLD